MLSNDHHQNTKVATNKQIVQKIVQTFLKARSIYTAIEMFKCCNAETLLPQICLL